MVVISEPTQYAKWGSADPTDPQDRRHWTKRIRCWYW